MSVQWGVLCCAMIEMFQRVYPRNFKNYQLDYYAESIFNCYHFHMFQFGIYYLSIQASQKGNGSNKIQVCEDNGIEGNFNIKRGFPLS